MKQKINENRITTARKQNQTVRYEYDALGRRVSRRGKYVGATGKYQNGLGIDNKLSAKKGANTSYFLSDHLGSTNGLADASGNLTSSASYDSFDNAIHQRSEEIALYLREIV